MARQRRYRSRPEIATLDLDLGPLVTRALAFLETSPRGASRVDILSATNLQASAWPALRSALEGSGAVTAVGRGPGLRHVHRRWLGDHPAANRPPLSRDGPRLTEARVALKGLLRKEGTIDSNAAQDATGLRADPVRRLLLELVDEGIVERSGKKRSTRYQWIG